MRRRTVSQRLDATRPVNWDHPLNQGLVGYWSASMAALLPGWWGGRTVYGGVRGAKPPHDATLVNGPTWVGCCGRFGINLDGVDDSIDVADASVLRFGSGDFTLLLWAYSPTFQDASTQHHTLTHKGDPEVSGGWTWQVLTDGAGTSQGKMSFRTGAVTVVTGTTQLQNDTFYHLAVRRIGTDVMLFVNGQVDGSGTSSANLNDTSTLQFGRRNLGGYNGCHKGPLDGIRIYPNRGLSNAEMRDLYNESFAGNPNAWNWQRPTYSVPSVATSGLLLKRRRACA